MIPTEVSDEELLLDTDLLVIGGGLAGVAAAVAAAEGGLKTVLIERRTYLGAERMATLRPWLTPAEARGLEAVLGWNPGTVFVPDAFKRQLEDRLLAAGVQFLYGVRPIAIQPVPHEHGERFVVEVAGKFGRRRIGAARVIDATEQAVVARLLSPATPRLAPGATLRLLRSMEWLGVDRTALTGLTALADVEVPQAVSPAVRFHPGHLAEEGHVLVEHAMDVPLGDDLTTWQTGLEVEARLATMSPARWLREHHPAFAQARLTETAHELVVPALWRMEGSVPGLWVAGGCAAHLSDSAAAALVNDTAALARLGREVGEQAAANPAPGHAAHPQSSGHAAHPQSSGHAAHPQTPAEPQEPGASAEPPAGHAQTPAPVALPMARRTVDVLVIGGGTSGASAALGAAQHGASTLLAEMLPGLGGTGTLGGVDSYWFGRKGGFNQEISRRVAREHAWMGHTGGKWNVEAKMAALLQAEQEVGVEVLLNTVLTEIRRTPTGRVTGAVLATPDGLIAVQARVVIDATGDGDAAVLAGAPYIYGSDREGIPMWYSMAPHLKPGMTKNNFTSTVDVGDPFDYTRAVLSARRRLPGHDHGPYVAPRESRHILAATRLTLTDILTMRRWPDVINIHFSNHDIKGHNTSDWLRMGLLPPNLEIEIPWRLLLPTGVDGLIVAGKAFSVTHDALPPVRMQADLENLGFVAGVAAAMAAARGVTPRELNVRELQAALVQHDILPESVLTRTVADPRAAVEADARADSGAGADRGLAAAQTPAAAPLSEAEMRRWIEALDDETKLYLYGEMKMEEVRREPIPMVMVCTAGPAIVPLLKEELARPDSPRRLQVARALAWYGDQAATPVLLAAIDHQLGGGPGSEGGPAADSPGSTGGGSPTGDHPAGAAGLPHRGHISYTQASPDHGAMPELAYLLHSLAMARDPRALPVLMPVAERLNPTRERLEDQTSGLFHYVDAICDVAERLGSPDVIPVLRRLHEYHLFRDRQSQAMVQPDYFEERLAFLELTIGRALARCGSPEGVAILESYLGDSRRMLVRYAQRELAALKG